MSQSDTSPHPTQSPSILILVTGSRHARYEQWADLVAAKIWNHAQGRPYELVHGDARGIDKIADAVAFRTSPTWNKASNISRFPAHWNLYGGKAGPLRNRKMLDYCLARQREGAVVICLAFHPDLASSKGTGHMVKIARSAGIPVETFDGRSRA